MQISLVEVTDVVGRIGQVVSRFPGTMLRSTLIAGPFHQVLKLFLLDLTVQDGGNFMLSLSVNLNQWQGRLGMMWNKTFSMWLK